MSLEQLKTEYKKSIRVDKMDSEDDYDQLIEEIDSATDLDEFVTVAGLWMHKDSGRNKEYMILKRILEEK